MIRKMQARIFFAFFFSVLLSAAAFGQSPMEKRIHNFNDKAVPDGPGFMRGSMGPPMEDWSRRLNLTEEQSVKLRESRESYLKDTLAWRNELVVKRFDLRDMLRNSQPDPNQVLAKQREISELESRIEERAVIHQLEMRKVLTPEQLQLLPPHFGFGGGGFRGPHMMRGRFRGMDQP
jgi:Spy/CpxP family protein refolding chaperone